MDFLGMEVAFSDNIDGPLCIFSFNMFNGKYLFFHQIVVKQTYIWPMQKSSISLLKALMQEDNSQCLILKI